MHAAYQENLLVKVNVEQVESEIFPERIVRLRPLSRRRTPSAKLGIDVEEAALEQLRLFREARPELVVHRDGARYNRNASGVSCVAVERSLRVRSRTRCGCATATRPAPHALRTEFGDDGRRLHARGERIVALVAIRDAIAAEADARVRRLRG